MKNNFLKGVILFTCILTFVEVYKLLLFSIIKDYFLGNYTSGDAAYFIILLSRELPFLIAVLIAFMFRKRFLLRKDVLIVTIALSYIATRLIW